MISEFIQLIYPNLCPICFASLPSTDTTWCFTCDLKLSKTFLDPQCGPIHNAIAYQKPIEIGYAPYYFKKGNAVQQLLHQLKYKGRKELGIQLGVNIAKQLMKQTDCSQFDYIIPVPLHPSKMLTRGYNQAEVIAAAFALHCNLPLVSDNLTRGSIALSQTKKSRFNRWSSIEDAFYVNTESQFVSKHIVVVDDVFTTGATLSACIKALSSIKNIKCSVITAAIADY